MGNVEYIIQSAEYNQYLFECNKTKENLEPIELLPGIMVAVENESKAGGVDDDESPDGMGRMSLAQKRPIVSKGIYEQFYKRTVQSRIRQEIPGQGTNKKAYNSFNVEPFDKAL